MKILQKLLISFFIVVFISLSSGILSAKLISLMSEDITSVEEEKYPLNKQSTNYQRGATQLWVGTYIFANRDTSMGNQYIKTGKRLMKESREAMSEDIDTKVYLEKENSAIASSDFVIAATKEHIAAGLNPDSSEEQMTAHEDKIKFNLNILQQRTESLNLLLSTQVDKTQEEMTESLAKARSESKRMSSINYASMIISLIVSISAAVIISLIITRPLKKLSEAADKLTNGDMSVEIPEIKTGDEIQELGSLIAMQTSIIKMHQEKKKK